MLHGPSRLFRAPVLVALMVLAALAAATASDGATSHVDRCPSYNVVTHSSGTTATWHFYRLSVSGVSCYRMHRVVRGRLFGPARRVTSCPSGGVRVGSWKVVLCGGSVTAIRAQRSFHGRFTLDVRGPVAAPGSGLSATGSWDQNLDTARRAGRMTLR